MYRDENARPSFEERLAAATFDAPKPECVFCGGGVLGLNLGFEVGGLFVCRECYGGEPEPDPADLDAAAWRAEWQL